MPIFMSYSRLDAEAVKTMAHAFETAHRTVWYDHDLEGGEIWWETILRNIRETDVFLFAMSDHSLKSQACLAELAYAGALQRPILPVQVGHVSAERSHLLAGRQAVTFRADDARAGMAVLAAADSAAKRVVPLPIPRPSDPPIPFAYLGEIRQRIEGGELNNAGQLDVIAKLRRSLGEETDASARRDILAMLETLRDQPWRTAQALLEIHATFAAFKLVELELSGADTQEIRVPQGTDVPKPTPGWSEGEARESFLQRIGELVGELHEGKACQEANGTAEPGAAAVLRDALVEQDRPELEAHTDAATEPGQAAPPLYFAGVRTGRGGGPELHPAPPADPPTRSPRGDTASDASPAPFFPGVRQASAAHDAPKPPAIPRQRPGPQPVGGATQAPTAASPPVPPRPTARRLAVAALVVCAAFAALVAVTGRDAAAGVFVLPAVAATVALAFSAQVQKRAAAGNIASARRASVVTTVWAVVALGIAVAVLAFVLNSVPVTG
jgi:hypothetical protein